MPISVRTLAPTISSASYHFPANGNKAGEENWPWIQAPSNTGDLCENCSQLNFPWLFHNALSAYTVTNGAVTTKLSDGICLGLYGTISSRSSCIFCQLLVFTLQQSADVEMVLQYDDWPQKELWINNHFLGKDGYAMVRDVDTDERIARLGLRFKSDDEHNSIVNFGGRTCMIQQIFKAPSAPTRNMGRALDTDVAGLVQTIKDWVHPCLVHEIQAAAKHEDSASIRLVDTYNNCIVGPLRRQRYVALR